ncbi:MAG: hypothetical protein ACKOW8_06300, partial [Flavobacteriales bacterium]
MPTVQQLIRRGRTPKTYRSKSVALDACPQRRGVCTKVYTTTPKKPNCVGNVRGHCAHKS